MATNDDNSELSGVYESCILTNTNNNFRVLYLNSQLADVYFTFKSGDERVPAHKFILTVISPVFETAFLGSMPETNEIQILDECVDAAAFKEFLQFFYLKEVKISLAPIQGVIHLAKKYQISECLNICSSFLIASLSNDEICWAYQLAIHYELNDLKTFCRSEISINIKDVLKSDGFLNCDWKILNEIVKLDKLYCQELVLLDACLKWAQNACERNKFNANIKRNIRKLLKDTIYEIRYKNVTFSELKNHLKDSFNPYFDSELSDIKRIIESKRKCRNAGKFNCSARVYLFDSIPWNDSEKVVCNLLGCDVLETLDHDRSSGKSSLTFSSNQFLIFGGFELTKCVVDHYTCCDYTYYNISVERMDLGTKFVNEFFHKMKKKSLNSFKFEKPVLIEKNVRYKIELDRMGGSRRYRFPYIMEGVKLCNGATITFYSDTSSSNKSVEKGIFYKLFFNDINA